MKKKVRNQRSSNTEDCGETCFQNPLLPPNWKFYCQKNMKCCPKGAFSQECSTTCGPYDPEGKNKEILLHLFTMKYHTEFFFYLSFAESFGSCSFKDSKYCSGGVCPMDGPCNVECKPDNQCKYSDWVFSKSGNIS